MKYLSVLLVLSLSLVACNKFNNGPIFNAASYYDYKAEVGKKLVLQRDTISKDDIRERYIIEDGNNIVFTFRHIKDDTNALDDEYVDVLRFEVEQGATEFSFDNNTLKNSTVVYNAWGAWSGVADVLVTDGFISGKKVDGKTWDVLISVAVPTYNEGSQMKNLYHAYRCEEE